MNTGLNCITSTISGLKGFYGFVQVVILDGMKNMAVPMADQGVWFKLWTTALHDPDLANLPLEDFARWALLGTYIKAHGTTGRLRLAPPARALCALLQVPDFAALHALFHRLPNVIEEREESSVSPETTVIVSYRNWAKYQGDYSTARVRKFREMKRSKRRGEERRREEKKTTTAPHAQQEASESNGFSTWPPEWDPLKAKIEALPFLKQHAAWLDDLQWWITLDEWLTSAPKPLDELLTDAVAHIVSSGYVPRTKQALRSKIKNCLHVAGRIAEREAQREKPASY